MFEHPESVTIFLILFSDDDEDFDDEEAEEKAPVKKVSGRKVVRNSKIMGIF